MGSAEAEASFNGGGQRLKIFASLTPSINAAPSTILSCLLDPTNGAALLTWLGGGAAPTGTLTPNTNVLILPTAPVFPSA